MKIQLSFALHALFLFLFSFKTHLSIEIDTITPGQSITGNQTITSQNQIFELGFFKPGNSNNYYVAIRYKKIGVPTLVWVANRDKPLPNKFSSKLQLTEDGNLVLTNQSNIQVWSTNTFSNTPNTSVAVLEDTGNLVLRKNPNSSVLVWQSFDHPTDTWLPGAKLGLNKLNRERQIYISWKDPSDPEPGPFSLELDTSETKQYFILKNGYRHWTCGIWPGRVSVYGTDTLANNYNNIFYVSNERENYFSYSVTNSSVLTRFVMDSTGELRQLVWQENLQNWVLIWARPKQQCEIYAYCGQYGGCNQFSAPTCRCLQGFEPKIPGEWTVGNNSDGCVRRTPLLCDKGGKDRFLMVPNIRLPANSVPLTVGSSEECELACLKNCSCTAYTYDGECLLWKEDLLNIQYLSFGDNLGRNLSLRLATKELMGYKGKTKGRIIGTIAGGAAGIFALCVALCVVIWNFRKERFSGSVKAKEDSLVVFKYRDLRTATNNFSRKVGEGGFGSVFRGELTNSTAIAVKKLKCCRQEEKQFRTEVSTMGTIHHVNLVRLCGFCVEGRKRFLVYDYMPNGSLETHLFGNHSDVLDWNTRYQIALGTARGLAYLHEKCRDCIVHCDIKPENILLDSLYNAKVSDFGLAKLIGREFSRVLTTVKGTRGYLAPEWISGVAITPKADVFSYGMMLFEIISGRRNWEVTVEDDGNDYFPARLVDELSKGGENEILSLIDPKLEHNANVEELIRASRVAGWCIQEDEKDRPSMGHVVQILEGVKGVITPPIPTFLKHIAVRFGEDSSPNSL